MVKVNYTEFKNLNSAQLRPASSEFQRKPYLLKDVYQKNSNKESVTKNGLKIINTNDFICSLRKFVHDSKKALEHYQSTAFSEIAATIDNFFTRFDTPAIVKAREELSAAPLTHLIKTPERDLLRQSIAEKLYENGASKKGNQVYLIMGPPTSGKSTALSEPLAKKLGAMIIDPDMAKEYIPEYAGGKFAAAVHEESWIIAHSVIEKAIENKDNVVLPLVGSHPEEILQICNKFEGADYKIHLRLLDVSPEVAAERAVKRYDKTGRFVDPYYIYNEVGELPRQNFYKLLQERYFDTYAFLSNEVPKGQPPILIDKSTNLPNPLE